MHFFTFEKTRADLNSTEHIHRKSKRVTVNPPPIQTRVGRQIHTPARFVQLVHAVIASNDKYTADPAHVSSSYIVYINPARPGTTKSLLSKVMQCFTIIICHYVECINRTKSVG